MRIFPEKGDLKLIGKRQYDDERRNKLRVNESEDWYVPTVFQIICQLHCILVVRLYAVYIASRQSLLNHLGDCLILRKFSIDLSSWTLTSD